MFKFAFKTYMEDLERGIENPWPQNWWHALEKLSFLIKVRYHPLEPYYYIVHNKFMEEVKRCSMYEALMDPTGETDAVKTSRVVIVRSPMPWETEEAKRLLVGELCQSKNVVLSVAEENAESETLQDKKEQENDQYQNLMNEEADRMRQQIEPLETECTLSEQNPATELAENIGSDINNDHRTLLPNVDAYELTRLLRNEPKIYGNASIEEKRAAWIRISKDLKTTGKLFIFVKRKSNSLKSLNSHSFKLSYSFSHISS